MNDTVSTIQVHGNHYAMGLHWRALKTRRNYMREARQIGKDEGMDIVAVRHSDSKSYAGFVKSGNGVKKGMLSIAVALAHKLEDNWIGIFEIGDNQYLVEGVNSEAIIPQGDKVLRKDEAISWAQKLLGLMSSDIRIFAPDNLDIPGSKELTLAEIIKDGEKLPKDCQLKPLKFGLSNKELMMIGAAGVVVFSAYYVIDMKKQQAIEAERLAEMERQRLLAELEAQSGKKAEIESIEYPWPLRPSPQETINACLSAINSAEFHRGGWLLYAASCTENSVSLTYERDSFGSVSSFMENLDTKWSVNISNNYNTIEVAGSLSTKPYGEEDLIQRHNAESHLASYFQELMIGFSMVNGPSSKYTEEEIEAGIRSWESIEFNATTLTPTTLANDSFYIPGLKVDSISTSFYESEIETMNEWIIEGVVYVR